MPTPNHPRNFLHPNRNATVLMAAFIGVFLFHTLNAFANEGAEGAAHGGSAITFLWIAILLIMAKLSSLVERIGQPAVLGELVIGVILGNLALLGVHIFEPIKSDEFLKFLAELGVVILLFQVGLESNIDKMRKVGLRAFLVACVGVIVPFVLGTWIVGPWLLPGLSTNAYLFIGATLRVHTTCICWSGSQHCPWGSCSAGAAPGAPARPKRDNTWPPC